MSNVRFLYNTLFDEATLSTVPAGQEMAGWPMTNLQTSILSEAWKCPVDSVRLRVDLQGYQAISAIGLAAHSLKAASTVTFRCYSDVWQTEVFSQTMEAVGPLLGWLEGGWLESGWLGYPLPGDQLLYPRVTSLLPLSNTVGARYVALDFDNGGDPFYLGALFMGDLLVPEINFSFGNDLRLTDGSHDDQSLGGVVFTDEGEQYHEFPLTLEKLSEAEAVGGSFWRFFHYVGKRRLFVVQLMDKTLKHERLTTLVGKMAKDPWPKQTGPDKYRVDLSIREMI